MDRDAETHCTIYSEEESKKTNNDIFQCSQECVDYKDVHHLDLGNLADCHKYSLCVDILLNHDIYIVLGMPPVCTTHDPHQFLLDIAIYHHMHSAMEYNNSQCIQNSVVNKRGASVRY